MTLLAPAVIAARLGGFAIALARMGRERALVRVERARTIAPTAIQIAERAK